MGDEVVIYHTSKRRKWKRPRRWAPRRKFTLCVIGLDRRIFLRYVPFHGYEPVSFLPKDDPFGVPVSYRQGRPEPMKRRTAKVVDNLTDVPMTTTLQDTKILGAFPNFCSHCSYTRYDDGSPRKPGSVTIGVYARQWQLRARDVDGGVQLTCSALYLDDALAELELLLGCDDAPWEQIPDFMRGSQGVAKKRG